LTSISTRVPSARITERARQAHPGRVALTVVACLLMGAGWLAARILGILWLGLAWCAIAASEGWAQGRTAGWSQHVAERQMRASAGRS
jgi:hypothetical protein